MLRKVTFNEHVVVIRLPYEDRTNYASSDAYRFEKKCRDAKQLLKPILNADNRMFVYKQRCGEMIKKDNFLWIYF